jgi:hypothetical protein
MSSTSMQASIEAKKIKKDRDFGQNVFICFF